MERRREEKALSGGRGAVADRDEMIRDHMWLVKCVAGSMAETLPRSVEIDDLISAGAVGLIQAVRDFDPLKGAKLETYARYRIRGAILDELRRGDRLSRSVRSRLKLVERAVEALERRTGRSPTDEEIAEEAGIPAEEVPEAFSAAAGADLCSLDEIFGSGRGEACVDAQGISRRPPDPESKLERKQMERILVQAIRELPRIEKILLSLYYYEGLGMREIGEVLGISESRISQIHSRAILLLRAKIRARLSA